MRTLNFVMFRKAGNWLPLSLALVCMSALAAAQSDAPAPPPPPHDMNMVYGMGPVGPMMGMAHDGIGEGKTVKGAPMSGEIVVTRDQSLADGNSIHAQNQTMIYRDSEGRVRREIEFELVTPTTGAAKRNMVVITDPVSGNRYMLNPENKTAHQMPLHPGKLGHGGPDGLDGMHGMGARVEINDAPNLKTEQLGTKTISGLQAIGTRMTHTIPAGEIGNANPIEVVSERWYSSDLQLPLLMTHKDPMMGTMTTALVNVSRAEPDASLFQVPADYKLVTGKPGEPLYMPMKP